MPAKRHHLATLTGLVLSCVLACTLLAPGAGAATTSKPYSVTLSPGSVPAGKHDQVITATLTNQTTTQQIGSVNLTSPFTVLGQSDNVVRLRNLALAPGAAYSVDLHVDAPCTAGTYQWSVVAKQSNDFNGSGNDMTLSNGPIRSTVTGACALRFTTQPQDARVGQTITGTAFDPAGPAVAVSVVDGDGNVVTNSTAPVTVALGLGAPAAATLSGTKTVDAVAGVARFTNLKINLSGSYTLAATSPGLTPDTSSSFFIEDVATFCAATDVDCTTGNVPYPSNGRSNVNATAHGTAVGYLTLSFRPASQLDCPGYLENTGNVTLVTGPDRTKLLTFTIDKTDMNASPSNGAAQLEMCFSAPYLFTTKSGGQAMTGLLPDCGTAPCVASRKKNQAGDGIIVVQAPGGTLDPAFRP
jgi:hypothetical protein